ncbi:MAG: hypothetical protein Q7U54_10040 [Bacteroidales bacterium]|nr:hypothetical protein [Bacteroidales bacterium]
MLIHNSSLEIKWEEDWLEILILTQYTSRVRNITEGSDEQKIETDIQQIESFFRQVGILTLLNEHQAGQDNTVLLNVLYSVRCVQLAYSRMLALPMLENC